MDILNKWNENKWRGRIPPGCQEWFYVSKNARFEGINKSKVAVTVRPEPSSRWHLPLDLYRNTRRGVTKRVKCIAISFLRNGLLAASRDNDFSLVAKIIICPVLEDIFSVIRFNYSYIAQAVCHS